MSYILDALKRADAERTRGLVPGIQAQQSATVNTPVKEQRWSMRSFFLIFTGMGLTLLFVMVWWWINTAESTAIDTSMNTSMNRLPVGLPATMNASTNDTAPVPTPLASIAPMAPVVVPLVLDKRLPLRVLLPEIVGVPPLAATVERVLSVNDLSDDVRRTLPKIVISGATYAENPAYRMLIINGQVFHEGEKLLPDLRLEQIKTKTVVLNYKGTRYFVTY